MNAIPVNVQRARGVVSHFVRPLDLQADIGRVRKLALLMDSHFEVAGVKLGWDAIIGLIPVVGDAATALIGVYPIHVARKHKLGRFLQFRMTVNLLLDWALGSIPLLGDIFDVAFKANLKNLALLERAAQRRT